MHRFLLFVLACAATSTSSGQAGTNLWLDDRFELPAGFRIYRAAGPELAGGSYALTLDGQGRLLVGDGTGVRRLLDDNGDGVFDRFEVMATGLGPRGPQGLLVYGDELYAVGGDGLQRFTGYQSGEALMHRGRLGNKLRTGGDHDTHMILRGHDGWLYLMAGNGADVTNRQHITEATSPALFEREASVFRISPDGARWECLASGGRNPPNLGLNFLGDLFSFDSDMEWHVGLPCYRPVRLNHWAIGCDQGWQEVGAYPPYFIDNLPGILDVGRGSPNWGVFYEHTLLPEKYRDAFLVCDYRWKRESDDKYATTGRLVAFFLRRQGAGWSATMETVAKPRPGARDTLGRVINFALVDVAVAPDGSLFLSDHNQGIWRICYQPGASQNVPAPLLVNPWDKISEPHTPAQLLDSLLTLPQPGSERTRLREEELKQALGKAARQLLEEVALDTNRPLARRLRALRLLSPAFAQLPPRFLEQLAKDAPVEIRAQAAGLLAWRADAGSGPLLLELLGDKDPFVRRRAAEALARLATPDATTRLVERLNDPERLVRAVAMNALAHRPTSEWFALATAGTPAQTRLRALTAALLRREPASTKETQGVIRSLLSTAPEPARAREDRLDLLRVLELCRDTITADSGLLEQVRAQLLEGFPDGDRAVRWEQIRLLGSYQVSRAFPALLSELEREPDPVTQFHLAQALVALPAGWSPEEEKQALAWFLNTQQGWFAEFSGKGVQFPEFWSTVLTDLCSRHRDALVQQADHIQLDGLLGGATLNVMAQSTRDGSDLLQLFERSTNHQARLRIVRALQPVRHPRVKEFLQTQYDRVDSQTPQGRTLQGAILQNWAGHLDEGTLPSLIHDGLFHEESQVVLPVAQALSRNPEQLRTCLDGAQATHRTGPKADQADFAAALIHRLTERPALWTALESVLVAWSGETRPGFKPGSDFKRRPDDATRAAALSHWQQWYARRFGKPLPDAPQMASKSDAELYQFLLGETVRGGNANRGAKVYENLQCQLCHGGGISPGREGHLFGPDLAGATRRLNRIELADSLVYPSKQVADRFKAVEVTLKDGTAITGFVTEQNADSVTLADREQVRKLPRATILSIAALASSLMPDALLSRLSWDEVRDLMSFLESR